ncbi:hypothetical protein PINS_up018520 [Pythium insidiosum]|nr:hypothetical protein PINS_up018520 [Pythium insidiosum]
MARCRRPPWTLSAAPTLAGVGDEDDSDGDSGSDATHGTLEQKLVDYFDTQDDGDKATTERDRDTEDAAKMRALMTPLTPELVTSIEQDVCVARLAANSVIRSGR